MKYYFFRERNLRDILDMMWGANGSSIQNRIPECPVRNIGYKNCLCFNFLSRFVLSGSEDSLRSISVARVTSCVGTVDQEFRLGRGSGFTSNISANISFQTCPTCRGRLMGRCHGFEEYLQSLNINWSVPRSLLTCILDIFNDNFRPFSMFFNDKT